MSRLLNRQRQLAEQGRLRLGYTVPATKRDGTPTTRPVRSETWVVTSHSREHVEHAATLWGGDAHEWEPMGNGAKQWRVITQTSTIPGILPPGDPLNQSYEQWNRGGCIRRCDGVTEELSGSPCICLARHGENWYDLSPREVCSSKSRLKVLLPDMPGLGSWRMETGSYYATDEIAGMVDTIRGAVGEAVLVPVTLRIEPRTRVANGETKQFVVPVLELRGVTAGALLSGTAVETGALRAADLNSTTPAALQAPKPETAVEDPYAPYFVEVEKAASTDELTEIWGRAREGRLVGTHATPSARTQEFIDAWKARAHAVAAAPQPASEPAVEQQPDEDGAYDAEWTEEPAADAEAVWNQILKEAGSLPNPMGLSEVSEDFKQRMGGLLPDDASAGELQHYLSLLTGERAA